MRVDADAEWPQELRSIGVPASLDHATAPDLSVGSVSDLRRLLACGARAVLVEGDARRALRRAGYHVSTYVALPHPQQLRLVAASEHRRAAAYALTTRVAPSTTFKRLRRNAAAWLLQQGLVPPLLPLISVGQRGQNPPFLVSAAEAELGIGSVGWFLVPGSGDVLSRGAFLLFSPSSKCPDWALKFSRVRGYDAPFRREEEALRRARAVGRVVEAHSPMPVARLDVAGLAASIETAAQGRRLDSILSGPARTADKVALVERIAQWIVELAAASRAPVERLGEEWRRLVELAGVAGRELGVPIPLPEAPFFEPVLQHNDLGAWNIIVERERFVAVDWESSQRYGAPLWDLWYFLVHVLPQLAGVANRDLDGYLRRLLRGEDEWSPLFFHWTHRAADEIGIPISRLGTLATLCWLHHAHSHPKRASALAAHGHGGNALALVTERLPEIWLTDDGLGLSWRCLGS